jgi:hypothetical protein
MTEEQIENLEWSEIQGLLKPRQEWFIFEASKKGLEIHEILHGCIGSIDAAVSFSGKIVNSKLFEEAYDDEVGYGFPSLKGIDLTSVTIVGYDWDTYLMVVNSNLPEDINNAILAYASTLASELSIEMTEYFLNY